MNISLPDYGDRCLVVRPRRCPPNTFKKIAELSVEKGVLPQDSGTSTIMQKEPFETWLQRHCQGIA